VIAHAPTDGAQLVTAELAYASLLTDLHFVRKVGSSQVVLAWRPPSRLLDATNVNGIKQPDVNAERDFFTGALVFSSTQTKIAPGRRTRSSQKTSCCVNWPVCSA
jgi:hypothetical protein